MSSKKIEKIIKDSIDIEFEDITNNLLNQYNYTNKKERKKVLSLRVCTSLCMILIICVISQYINRPQNNQKLLENNKNELYVNEINYRTRSELMNFEINISQGFSKSYEDLSKIFNYDLHLNENNISSIICKNNSFNNEVDQCEIIYRYNSNNIYINIKNNNYPTFTTEMIDSWNENINESLKVSTIKNNKLIIIQNLDNNKFISQYYNDEVLNYRTKIMINNVGISFESYKTELDNFVSCIEEIISQKK